MSTVGSICVYCGSSPGRSETYVEAGRALGRSMADAGVRLVYGGGAKGVMGAVAEGVLEGGGRVTGIIPRFLISKEASETALARLDELIVTDDMHARKHAMFERSDAFAALPGGIGTVEELVEIMTWAQLGRHRKPVVLVNIGGFWNPFLAFMDHMKAEGFLHTAHRIRPLVAETAGEVLPIIRDAAGAAEHAASGDDSVISRL